ncbi:hypothetical protein RUND412_003277 [Rhizina undulata]
MPPLTLEANLSHLSSLPPFNPPSPPSGNLAAEALDSAVSFLYKEFHTLNACSHGCKHDPETYTKFTNQLDTYQKLQVVKQLLTIRPGRYPALPEDIADAADTVTLYMAGKKKFTSARAIKNIAEVVSGEGVQIGRDARKILGKVAVWKGDITTLRDVTAIVNAANSEMIGCFNPDHPCIDNAIQTAAGPRLREECKKLMDLQGSLEETGSVKITRGYMLPAKYVFHTVGPINRDNEVVGSEHRALLKSCYKSCLGALEQLPESGKSIAFCCISTGIFGFPRDVAVEIAVDTVVEHFRENVDSGIEKVIFNVFDDKDLELYTKKMNDVVKSFNLAPPTPLTSPSFATPTLPTLTHELSTAISWISSASRLLITAGAGLSASDGYDFTSESLFRKNFPGTWDRGFTCLYDLIGFNGWESEADKWGYYFTHLQFAKDWPLGHEDSVYTKLLKITELAQKRNNTGVFVRTSNADMFFARSGFSKERMSTPQGSYDLLQCLKKCRSDAVFPSAPFLEKGIPWVDPKTQKFKEGYPENVVPKCPFCGDKMFLCVRGGNWFNESMFLRGNERYRKFVDSADLRDLVVLELGAGFNTPGVLRWPDESLAERGAKLIRVGLGGSEVVPWELERRAVGIKGDAKWVVGEILKALVGTDGVGK